MNKKKKYIYHKNCPWWPYTFIIFCWMSDELAPRNNCYTWENTHNIALKIVSFFLAATAMDPHSGNTSFLKDTPVLEHDMAHLPCCTPPPLLSYLYTSSLISSQLTVCEGWPICKCLHSEIQLSLRGRLLLSGHGWEERRNNQRSALNLSSN